MGLSTGALLAGVCWTQVLTAAALDAQQALRSPRDAGFVLSTDDPHRSPSPFIGNGHLGVVIPALGIGASPSIMAGMYEEAAGDVPRIVSVPAWNAIEVSNGDRWLEPAAAGDGSVTAYRQVLDLRTATARTSYHWASGSKLMSVRMETFISRAEPRLSAIRLTLAPQFRGRLRVRFAIVGWPPPRRIPLATQEKAAPDWKPADIWYPGRMVIRSRTATRVPGGARLAVSSSPEGRQTITLAQAAAITWGKDLPGLTVTTTAEGDTARVEIAFDGSRGRAYTLTQIQSTTSSIEEPQPLSRATRLAQTGSARGFAALAAENAGAWRHRWATDIEITGDPELQRVVRSMLFYLLCSADAGTRLAIPPMGLSSGGYYGHVFWDSDTWMFPSLLVTHPDVAHSLVSFRSRSLAAAQANAQANGYRGAMYPWESDERGRETTPHFAVQNARSEIHVTGDVALAQWQYYLVTGDSAWLAREGYPVIRETADFWVSRATLDSTTGQYHIQNVVSVAEGLIGVSDDAYTNAVARKNLEVATLASQRLGAAADPRWEQIAGKLHLPYDSLSGFFRTYEGAPDSTLGDVTPLLAYPLGVPMSEGAKRAQLEQAARRLLAEGPGAMMGSTLLSVDAAELGDRSLIDSLLPHSYQDHLKGPFLMLSETPKNDAVNFVTGAGGFLQQVIYGYTGLRLRDGGLEPVFPAILPSRVTRLVLRNVYSRGKRYDVVVDSTGSKMLPHSAAPAR